MSNPIHSLAHTLMHLLPISFHLGMKLQTNRVTFPSIDQTGSERIQHQRRGIFVFFNYFLYIYVSFASGRADTGEPV